MLAKQPPDETGKGESCCFTHSFPCLNRVICPGASDQYSLTDDVTDHDTLESMCVRSILTSPSGLPGNFGVKQASNQGILKYPDFSPFQGGHHLVIQGQLN